MTFIEANPRIYPGANNPPEPTPFEIAQQKVEDIYGEASQWLDGAVVDSQELADGIANLISMLGDAWDVAEAARKAEKKPFDDGAKEVQERYRPILAKTDLAIRACKNAVAPWLKKRDDEIEARAKATREEADRKRQEAEAAIRASDAANLAERERAEALIKDAKRAEKIATRAANETATAGGSLGKATGLRTVYTITITDAVAFARYAWAEHREEMNEFLGVLADKLKRAGKREIPGCKIEESKVPV